MESLKSEDIDQIGLRNVNAELYQRFRVRCAEKKIHYGTGFEQAISAWLISSAGEDLLSYPPFDKINRGIVDKFCTRCKEKKLDVIYGIGEAIVVWLRNLSFTDPYPSREPGKPGKPGRPRKDSTKWKVK
jgi:hypothetical protein